MHRTFNLFSNSKMASTNSHNTIASGFTIIELIVVISIISILAATASKFIANPLSAYMDTESHARLTDLADGTLRAMARNIRNTLPNSVRVVSGVNASTNNSFLEFIPIKQASRYRGTNGSAGAGNILDFTASNDSFDVVGEAVNVESGDQLVIYNLGVSDSNVYESSPGNMRALTTIGTGLTSLTFSGSAFSYASPNSRFQIIQTPVTYACDMTTDTSNKKLYMYANYSIQSTQPSTISTLDGLSSVKKSLVAEHLSSCQFGYSAGISQRTGMVNITLAISEKEANVRLMHQVNINNSP